MKIISPATLYRLIPHRLLFAILVYGLDLDSGHFDLL